MAKNACGVILVAKNPFRRNKKGRMGKVVMAEDGEVVLRFHGMAVMRRTGTVPVHLESLDYLMKAGGSRVEFRLSDGRWLWTTPEEVLNFGFVQSFHPALPPCHNLPLKHWRRMDPPPFVFVPDRFTVKLAPADPRETLRGRPARRPRQRGERVREHEAAEQLSLL